MCVKFFYYITEPLVWYRLGGLCFVIKIFRLVTTYVILQHVTKYPTNSKCSLKSGKLIATSNHFPVGAGTINKLASLSDHFLQLLLLSRQWHFQSLLQNLPFEKVTKFLNSGELKSKMSDSTGHPCINPDFQCPKSWFSIVLIQNERQVARRRY